LVTYELAAAFSLSTNLAIVANWDVAKYLSCVGKAVGNTIDGFLANLPSLRGIDSSLYSTAQMLWHGTHIVPGEASAGLLQSQRLCRDQVDPSPPTNEICSTGASLRLTAQGLKVSTGGLFDANQSSRGPFPRRAQAMGAYACGLWFYNAVHIPVPLAAFACS
jgi:hypothetical protein